METLLTTADLPENKRFNLFREIVSDHFMQVENYQLPDRPFSGEISKIKIKDITFSLVQGSGVKSVRTPELIRRSKEEIVFVHYQLNGTWLFSQEDCRLKLEAGDMTFCDSNRPFFAIQTAPFSQLLIHVPRDQWLKKLGRPELMNGLVVRNDSQMGTLVANVLRQIITTAGDVETETAHRLLDVGLSLVVAAFGDLISNPENRQSSGRAALLYRAKLFIEENLNNPELNPEKVAAALRISERYLQDLFNDIDMSVGKFIWEMRLEKCRRDLSDPLLSDKNVTEIAFNHGFNSCSHFSRRFREAFSMTASEYRHLHRSKSGKEP